MTEPLFEPPVSDDTAGRLRNAWLTHEKVRLILTEHCVVPLIVGRVHSVSVTGATIVIDGWEIPTEQVIGVESATRADIDVYADMMHHLREAAT
jgi:hypothetical protein